MIIVCPILADHPEPSVPCLLEQCDDCGREIWVPPAIEAAGAVLCAGCAIRRLAAEGRGRMHVESVGPGLKLEPATVDEPTPTP